MRIIQIRDDIRYGDAVSNDAINIKMTLQKAGCETMLFAEKIDPKIPKGTALPFKEMGKLSPNDIMIFHPTGMDKKFIYRACELPCRKMIRHHVFTPVDVLDKYGMSLKQPTETWNQALCDVQDRFDYILSPSQFDLEEMRSLGYKKQRFKNVPYLIDPKDYLEAYPVSSEILNKYSDGYTNILYVSRIVSNKKQEDAIAAFAYYKKYFNPKSRIIFPGRVIFQDYYNDLCAYSVGLGLGPEDVVFPDSVPFSDLLAYYKVADIFLFTSEHEGFGITPIEAMIFNIPVIAYNFTAIPEAMSGGGIILEKKDPVVTAVWMDRLMRDSNLRKQVISDYPRVIRKYDRKAFTDALLSGLGDYIKSFLHELSPAERTDAFQILSRFDAETAGLIWG